MNDKKDAHGFPVEAKFSFSSVLKVLSTFIVRGDMSSEGADRAGILQAEGVNSFYRRCGIAVVIIAVGFLLFGVAMLTGSIAPDGVINAARASTSYNLKGTTPP